MTMKEFRDWLTKRIVRAHERKTKESDGTNKVYKYSIIKQKDRNIPYQNGRIDAYEEVLAEVQKHASLWTDEEIAMLAEIRDGMKEIKTIMRSSHD